MKLINDQLGNKIFIDKSPRRIISIVPSQTELLCDLGLSDSLIGITKFCVHPKSCFQKIKKVGGTKTLNLQLIRELNPDIIIANKEENELSQIEQLKKEYPIWISDIYTIQDALDMIERLGLLFEKEQESLEIVSEINQSFLNVKKYSGSNNNILYLIWKKPFMAAGKRTFIDSIISSAGFKNVLLDPESRYPELSLDEIQRLKPDFIFLSSEPYPFKQEDLQFFQHHLPETKVIKVDGELFSWYGSRLKLTPSYLSRLNDSLTSL